MGKDVIIDGMNITAMQGNFVKLKNIVKAQGEALGKQKKDLRLCFSRIEYLQKELDKKQNDDVKQGMESIKGMLLRRRNKD